MSLLCWGLQSWTQDSRWDLTRAEQRRRIPSLDLLATLLLMQPRIQLAFWDLNTHCQVLLSFSLANTPKSFLVGLLSIHSPPSLHLFLVLPWPMCWTLHLALLNFMRFTQAHLSSLSRSLWVASLPSSVSTASHSLVSLANLLRVHSIPLSMSPTKMLNSTSPNTNPWGMALITGIPRYTKGSQMSTERKPEHHRLLQNHLLHHGQKSPCWQLCCSGCTALKTLTT